MDTIDSSHVTSTALSNASKIRENDIDANLAKPLGTRDNLEQFAGKNPKCIGQNF